jgi:hypothetical protein
MATQRYAAHGPEDEVQHFERPPQPPELGDLSWQDYAACKNDPRALQALEQILQKNKRPWEPWCFDCPVKGHCALQGLKEDAEAPARGRDRFQPLVYGGLTPKERTRVDQDWLENKLYFERAWLKKRGAASA